MRHLTRGWPGILTALLFGSAVGALLGMLVLAVTPATGPEAERPGRGGSAQPRSE